MIKKKKISSRGIHQISKGLAFGSVIFSSAAFPLPSSIPFFSSFWGRDSSSQGCWLQKIGGERAGLESPLLGSLVQAGAGEARGGLGRTPGSAGGRGSNGIRSPLSCISFCLRLWRFFSFLFSLRSQGLHNPPFFAFGVLCLPTFLGLGLC